MINNFQPYNHDKQSGRILFIDLMRAYAILMMIQGHVIDTFINPVYRNPENWIYSLWNHMRGITAPVFFFSAGAIFSYLLLRNNLPLKDNKRFYKGIKRVFVLLFIGYFLRFNPHMLLNWKNFDFYDYKRSFGVDALHCIAIGLGLIIISYVLNRLTRIPVWIYYLIFAFMSFYLYPSVVKAQWSEILPLPLADYFTKEYGSAFPVIPWIGFVMWGALPGYILSKKAKLASNNIFAAGALLLGIILVHYSGDELARVFRMTNDENFHYLSQDNFLYYHLGNIFIVLGILAIVANLVKIPEIVISVGKNTLLIYVVHVFVIYDTGYNIGLQHYFGNSLSPYQAVTAAIMLLFFFILLVYLREKWKKNLKNKFREYFRNKLIAVQNNVKAKNSD